MMSKKVIVDLSEDGINKLLAQLQGFDKKLEEANKKVVDDLAKYTKKVMKKTHNSSSFRGNTKMSFDIEGDDLNKEVIMYGYQAIYSEFGTGTEGANNPHPTKGNYELKGYNTGETIRTNKSAESNASQHDIPVGGLYWTYTDENGQKQYTQGIPAQKEGYTALESGTKKAKNFIRKRVQEVLDDFN